MKKVKSADEILNEFNNRIKLSDFISKYVSISPRGNSFVGRCPFHNEKTPSFNVNDEKAFFYCFGCKAGGNVINFVSKYKNYSFLESLKFLANFLGIELKSSQNNQYNANKRLFDILEVCNQFFQVCLDKNDYAFKYIEGRIPEKRCIKTFSLGYCPDEKKLTDFLNMNGFTSKEIENSGLFIRNKMNEFFGRFKERIIFPIYNFNNKVVGFGGRSIRNSKIKYINSPESEIFKKGDILYGLSQNAKFIRESKEIFLVEGYLDVISLYKHGVRNAVATLGTTLSQNQIKKMWDLSDKPYICFDGDQAGLDSAKIISLKVLKFLVPGKSFRFIFFPNEHDPDSFISEKSKEEFMFLKDKSKDLSEVIWEGLLESINDRTPESLAFLDEKINQISKTIFNKKVSIEYLRFLRSKKDDFFWRRKQTLDIKNRKNNHDFKTNINNLMLIVFMIFDEDYLTEFQEEISSIKLNDNFLEQERMKILENYSNEKYQNQKSNLETYQEINPKFFQDLFYLKNTHLKNLKEEEKKVFFKHLLRNLRLPIVENERKILKKEIMLCKDEATLGKLIKKHDKINNEIKYIRSKEL